MGRLRLGQERVARACALAGAVAIAFSSILVRLSHASPSTAAIFRCAYALPALGALAAEPLYVLADTAIVGHLGRPQIAALGLAGTVLAGAFTIFNFLT
ncbi:MAG: hypothetical protein JOZ64_11900, partial [Solirubrobacterales bacterium]|nr:hypothetical protein [Solirubrobacterales bacterium]